MIFGVKCKKEPKIRCFRLSIKMVAIMVHQQASSSCKSYMTSCETLGGLCINAFHLQIIIRVTLYYDFGSLS